MAETNQGRSPTRPSVSNRIDPSAGYSSIPFANQGAVNVTGSPTPASASLLPAITSSVALQSPTATPTALLTNITESVQTPNGNVSVIFAPTKSGNSIIYNAKSIAQNVTFSQPINQNSNGIIFQGTGNFTYSLSGNQLTSTLLSTTGSILYQSPTSQTLFSQAQSNQTTDKAQIAYYQSLANELNTGSYVVKGPNGSINAVATQNALNNINSQLLPTTGPLAGNNALNFYQNALSSAINQATANSPLGIGSFNGSNITLTNGVTIAQPVSGSVGGSTQNLGSVLLKPTLGNGNTISLVYQSFQPANVTLNSNTSITDPITGKVYPIGISIGATTTYNPTTGSVGLSLPNYGGGNPLPNITTNLFGNTQTAVQNGNVISYNIGFNPITGTSFTSTSTNNSLTINSFLTAQTNLANSIANGTKSTSPVVAFPGAGTYQFFTGSLPNTNAFTQTSTGFVAGTPGGLAALQGNPPPSPIPFLNTYISNGAFFQNELSILSQKGGGYFTYQSSSKISNPISVIPLSSLQNQFVNSTSTPTTVLGSASKLFSQYNNAATSEVSAITGYLTKTGLVFNGPGSKIANAFGASNPTVLGVGIGLASIPLIPQGIFNAYAHPTATLSALSKQVVSNPLGFVGETVGTSLLLGTGANILSTAIATPDLNTLYFRPFGLPLNVPLVSFGGGIPSFGSTLIDVTGETTTETNIAGVLATTEKSNLLALPGSQESPTIAEITQPSNPIKPVSAPIQSSARSQVQIQIQRPATSVTGSQLAKFYASYGSLQQGYSGSGGSYSPEQFRELLNQGKTQQSSTVEENEYVYSVGVGQKVIPTRTQISSQLTKTSTTQSSISLQNQISLTSQLYKVSTVQTQPQLSSILQLQKTKSIQSQVSSTKQILGSNSLQLQSQKQSSIQSQSQKQTQVQSQVQLQQQVQFQQQGQLQTQSELTLQSKKGLFLIVPLQRKPPKRIKVPLVSNSKIMFGSTPDLTHETLGIREANKKVNARLRSIGLSRPL